MTEKDPVRALAQDVFRLLEQHPAEVTAGEQLSVAVHQPDPNVPEFHAAVMLHLVVGSTPLRAIELLHRVLLGKLQAKDAVDAKP